MISRRDIGSARLFFAVAVAAFLLKALLAILTVGTNDSLTWDRDLARLRTGGFADLYRHGVQYSSPAGRKYPRQPFIHPPPVLRGLRLLGALQDVTELPLHVWLRIACAFADAGALAVIWMMFHGTVRPHAWLLLAASPVSIFVSGFHGNTDPIMMFFVVLTVFLLMRDQPLWAAAAFAVACGVKLAPLIYAPAILLYLPTARQRAKWIAASAGVWIALSLPYLVEQPALILKTILGYGSAPGLWGFYFFSVVLQEAGWGAFQAYYAPSAKWIALLAATALPFLFKALRSPPPLFTQCGAITFLFLFLSPGFGLQYLAWTVPWIVTLGIGPMAAYSAVAGAFLLSVYLQAAGGVHRNAYADLLTATHFQMLILMGCVCWLSIGAMVWKYARLAGIRSDCKS